MCVDRCLDNFCIFRQEGFEDWREGVPASPRARPELTAPTTRRCLMTGTGKRPGCLSGGGTRTDDAMNRYCTRVRELVVNSNT